MKKYYLFFALLIAGCTSSTFIPFTNVSYPSHNTAMFVKDTTSIPYYYFYLGDYLLDSKTILYDRDDLLEMIIDEGNEIGADLITMVTYSKDTDLANYKGTYYTRDFDNVSCSFIRYLRDEYGKPIKRK